MTTLRIERMSILPTRPRLLEANPPTDSVGERTEGRTARRGNAPFRTPYSPFGRFGPERRSLTNRLLPTSSSRRTGAPS